MANQKTSSRTAGIGDEAVNARTGKTWAEWGKILDAAGGRKLNHKQIVAYLSEHYPKVGGWWTQMVTVGYEQSRGLREKHQKPGGYEISGSKTLAVPVARAFEAWKNDKLRQKWLPGEKITIRKAAANKSMRITWSDGTSSVSVNFYAKGDGRSQVAVQHGKLSSAKQAAAKKKYWADRLNRLKEMLE